MLVPPPIVYPEYSMIWCWDMWEKGRFVCVVKHLLTWHFNWSVFACIIFIYNNIFQYHVGQTTMERWSATDAVLKIYECRILVGIPTIEIKSYDHLIFMMAIPIYLEIMSLYWNGLLNMNIEYEWESLMEIPIPGQIYSFTLRLAPKVLSWRLENRGF